MSIIINNARKYPLIWVTEQSKTFLRKPCVYRNVGSYPVIIEPIGPINNQISTWNSDFAATTPSNSLVAKTCSFRSKNTGAPGISFNSSSGTWLTKNTDEIALEPSQNSDFAAFRLCQNPSNITTIFEQGVNPASPGIFQQTQGSNTYTIYPYKWIDNIASLTCIFSMEVLIESSKFISTDDLIIGCYATANNVTKYINLTDYIVKYSGDTNYLSLSFHQTYQFGSKYLNRIVITNHTATGFQKSFNTAIGRYYYITDPEIVYMRSGTNPTFGNGDYIQVNSFSITSQFIPSNRYVNE